MKKLISACFALITVSMNAQLVLPNAGMEDWTLTTLWDTPDMWSTSNPDVYFNYETFNVFQSDNEHGGNYSALLQAGSTDVELFSELTLGDPANEGNSIQPHTGRPDWLEFWTHYNIQLPDNAWIEMVLFAGEETVGQIFTVMAGATSEYTQMILPIEYLSDSEPDRVGIRIILDNTNNIEPYSFMYIDDMHFIYDEGSGDDVPNGGFEDWATYEASEPGEWQSTNLFTYPVNSVQPSSDAHSGFYSAQIISTWVPEMEQATGFVFLGDLENGLCDDQSLVIPENTIVHTIGGYYKYIPEDAAGDATVYLHYRYEDNDFCESAYEHYAYLPEADVWTGFQISVPEEVYTAWEEAGEQPRPEFLNIALAALTVIDGEATGVAGSTLWVDDLFVQYYEVAGIAENETTTLELYPNPATDIITIRDSQGARLLSVEILDALGRTVSRYSVNGQQINIADLPGGTYMCKATTSSSTATTWFVKQ